MDIRPSKIIRRYTLVDLTEKKKETKCQLCNCAMISEIALHPRICCIKRRCDQDSYNDNVVSESATREGFTEYMSLWKWHARRSNRYIVLTGEENSEGVSEIYRIVNFDDYVSFDEIYARTRAKVTLVDSIPIGARTARRNWRRNHIAKILKSSENFNKLPLEIVYAIADI